jgi:FAE1/Type III polyketide synthase-like protein
LTVQTRISRPVVTDLGEPLSQRDVLGLLGPQGDEFAEGGFDRCAVQYQELWRAPSRRGNTLQGRTAEAEDRLFEYAVAAVERLAVDPAQIATVVTSSLYSLGGSTLAHRLVEHFRMDPATDKYHVVGVGCASAVPLIRLISQSLEAHPGKPAWRSPATMSTTGSSTPAGGGFSIAQTPALRHAATQTGNPGGR